MEEHETELGFVHFVIHGRRAVDEQRERRVELRYRCALLIEEARHLLRHGSRQPLVEPPEEPIAMRGDPLLLQRAPNGALQRLRERRCALARRLYPASCAAVGRSGASHVAVAYAATAPSPCPAAAGTAAPSRRSPEAAPVRPARIERPCAMASA